MTLPAIGSYTDANLEALRVAVANEIERRANLATIPALITTLATTYIDGGGDPSDLSLTPDATAG